MQFTTTGENYSVTNDSGTEIIGTIEHGVSEIVFHANNNFVFFDSDLFKIAQHMREIKNEVKRRRKKNA